MKKKIILLLVSMFTVIIILINSTYSILFKVNETEEQAYTTGILEITSTATNGSVTLSNSLPMSDTAGEALTPYTFTITNTGNLTYNFDVKFLSTTTTENQITSSYIKIKVNDGEVQKLSDLTNGIILSDQTLAPEESIEVSIRVWLDEYTPNTEIGKVFNGKITTEGQAIYVENKGLNTLNSLGLTENTGTPDFANTSCTSGCGESTVGVYSTVDDLGTSYYFRGDVENNYVYFAGFYWRIIRINGDGTIRLIYHGTTINDSTNQLSTTSAWNSSYNDNAYVGYMYGTAGASTYEQTHSNTNNSVLKNTLDSWYQNNLLDYQQYISDSGFCGNRELYSGSGIGTNITYYGSYGNLVGNSTPSLHCPEHDLYTLTSSTYGNKTLTYPIGLITADEIALAGTVSSDNNVIANNKFYLYTGQHYRTMSPYGFETISGVNRAVTYGLDATGVLRKFTYTENEFGVRPVISISPETIQYGDGTSENPFRTEEEMSLTSEAVLTKLGLTLSSGTPNFANTSCSSGCEETTVGVYSAEDDLGTSYYFRGDVENNYVKFANYYWRIIRINGDGSIRMIYDGTSAHANGESSTDRVATKTSFNVIAYHNTYVGYMYGPTGNGSYESTHSNTTNSTIKTYLEDTWYANNILNTDYEQYVVDAIYCNDREVSTGNGLSTDDTEYKAYERLCTNKTPSLKCTQTNDRFTKGITVNGVSGNGKLKYSIGMITADESSMAGGVSEKSNSKFYLYSGIGGDTLYWTMTPHSFSESSEKAAMFQVLSFSMGTNYYAAYSLGVRPVISISPDAIQYGTGSSTDPFRLTSAI